MQAARQVGLWPFISSVPLGRDRHLPIWPRTILGKLVLGSASPHSDWMPPGHQSERWHLEWVGSAVNLFSPGRQSPSREESEAESGTNRVHGTADW